MTPDGSAVKRCSVMPLSTKGDLPIRRRSTSRFVSTLMAAFGWLAATAVRPRPDLVVELPKESRWARWGPTIVEGLVLAGLLLGLSEWREAQRTDHAEQLEDQRVEHAEQLEDQRAERADKRALQQTLYVAKLDGIGMQGEDLSHLSFGGRSLIGANLAEADLTGADLLNANLTGAVLFGADLSGANLGQADLTGADLGWANLTGTNLSEANLTGAKLDRSNLTDADMVDANLTHANLTLTDLPGTVLITADHMSEAKWEPTLPPTWPEYFEPPENAWAPQKDG